MFTFTPKTRFQIFWIRLNKKICFLRAGQKNCLQKQDKNKFEKLT